jgi:alkylation response protein AidB-like acyl-CoA dehydrogenase
MLLLQKSCMEAIRALLYQTYYYVDLSHEANDPAEREYAHDMFMINNPICKAYASDMAWVLTAEAIQVHGGYGFMEEYAPASLARDCKIYSLWEGTNFIQAQDFTGRKFTMNGGEPFKKWVAEIADFIAGKKTSEFATEFATMEVALASFKSIIDMNAEWNENNKQLKQLFATRTLHAAARIYCGKLLLDQALLASQTLAELGDDHFDANFYKGKIASAKFYVMNVVTDIFAFVKAMKLADTTAIDMPEDALM